MERTKGDHMALLKAWPCSPSSLLALLMANFDFVWGPLLLALVVHLVFKADTVVELRPHECTRKKKEVPPALLFVVKV